MDSYNVFIYGSIISAVSFFIVFFGTPPIIKWLVSKGRVVPDAHKKNRPNIPRPAGPILIIGIVAAEIILYFFTFDPTIIAISLCVIIAFIVGYIDDKKTMPGWFKPAALIVAAIPLIVLQSYSNHLNLVFGSAFIPILYVPLILILIPIAGNTINSIDVLNGVASGFMIITTFPLLASVAIFGSTNVFLAALPLLAATGAFYIFHRYPSRIFPGDSGTLLLGAMYGAIAITGSSEIIGVIALLPAVMNSFLFLASVKKIVEHREVKARPVILMDDFKLMASKDRSAPATLVRLILAQGPLGEKEIAHKILRLALYSSLLAFISISIQYYFVYGGVKLLI